MVWGSAEIANVQLQNNGELFFKPTCIGTSSQQQYSIRNMSRIPMRFEWKLHHPDKTLLTVEPSEGVIQPNEAQVGHSMPT